MKKYLFLLIIPILLLIPSDVFAEEGISPTQNEIFWRAENISTGDVETAQYVYTPGSWSNFGSNDSGFNLMTLGSFLSYQQTQGTYAAKITYYVSTTIPTYIPEVLSCGAWSIDVSNATCSIESGTFKDNVFTYVVNYRWTNSSGFIQLTLNIDNGLYLIPKDTRFMYQIDSLVFNPSQESIIIGQNQTIINQNQTIINNQNQNTQDIINNQNANSDKEIESQKVCTNYEYGNENLTTKGYLNVNGEIYGTSQSDSWYYSSDYLKIEKNIDIEISKNYTGGSSAALCLYDINKTKILCHVYNVNATSWKINTGNAYYIRFSGRKDEGNTTKVQGSYCQNGNQALNDSLEGIEDSLTDETPPDLSILEDSAGWLPAGPLDSVLNLPLTMFQNISNSLGGTCNPISIKVPFIDSYLSIPCMSTIYEKIGIKGFIDWIGLVASGFILYNYLLHLYQWVEDRLTLKDSKIEWGGV